jgi:UDP-N-acetylglucosamine 2-epimerase (non-hydrolysing)/GDP/UDP-N,N'-diacetylbacillosamine 2-epimerase (hydrolysing)
MPKIAVVTGSRAEYGLLSPIMQRLKEEPRAKLMVIATGTHLAEQFGRTVQEIKRDGFRVDAKVDMEISDDTGEGMARSFGKAVEGLAAAFDRLKPDWILILGDRGEALAAAIAGAYMRIPVAHVFGGDQCLGGDIDDSIRHAITKFAHFHFPALKEHAKRIIGLGEEPWRVKVVGAPGLDVILNQPPVPKEELARYFSLDLARPTVLMVQHPVGVETDQAAGQVRQTLEALKELRLQTVVIYPPADTGSKRVIKTIDKYRRFPFFRIFKSVPNKYYLGLMRRATVMVGNSSSGIVEAPSFHLPVVNIGIRQLGRIRSTNIIDVGYDKNEVKAAVRKALYDKKFVAKVKKSRNPYGDGKSAQRIVRELLRIKPSLNLLQKKMTY